MAAPPSGGDPSSATRASGDGWSSSSPPLPPPQGYGEAQPAYGVATGTPNADLASFGIRFAGAFIDGILMTIAAYVLGAVIGMDVNTAAGQGLPYVCGAIYYTYFHGSSGQTLGQKVVNIKVVDEATGGKIAYVRAFIRWLVSIVSGLVIALGYLWMLWDPKKQTWHDKASRTLVVKTLI